ncbi:outer membrane lipoprotein LolB [Comamonadaceae bacterium M7527]|nr:outer membrane lipoprotein LolB [Comamonadaceae bacterium M7527]
MRVRLPPNGLCCSHWCARAKLVGLALLLTGCANLQKPDTAVPAAHAWTGRFAMVVHSTPAQSQRASFELRGNEQAGELDVLSPIGTTLVRATWQPGKATLISGGNYTDFDNLAALSASLGETNLPVANLFSWLQGTSLQGTSLQASPITIPGSSHASAWAVDLCQAHQGRIKATRELPLPALSLTVLFQPPAPNAQEGCVARVDTGHSK